MGLCPDPVGGSYSAPQIPLAAIGWNRFGTTLGFAINHVIQKYVYIQKEVFSLVEITTYLPSLVRGRVWEGEKWKEGVENIVAGRRHGGPRRAVPPEVQVEYNVNFLGKPMDFRRFKSFKCPGLLGSSV